MNLLFASYSSSITATRGYGSRHRKLSTNGWLKLIEHRKRASPPSRKLSQGLRWRTENWASSRLSVRHRCGHAVRNDFWYGSSRRSLRPVTWLAWYDSNSQPSSFYALLQLSNESSNIVIHERRLWLFSELYKWEISILQLLEIRMLQNCDYISKTVNETTIKLFWKTFIQTWSKSNRTILCEHWLIDC